MTGAVRRLGEALLECLERPALPLASVVPLLLSTARLANAARTSSGLGRLFGQLTAVATSAAVAATNRLVDAQRALELAATTKPTLEELTRRVSSFAQSLEAVEDGMVELASELPVASDAVAEVEKASGRARESLAQGAIRQARWVLAALPRSPGLAGLTEDYRRLAALETALRGLAPAAGSPREAIFGERVEQVLLSAIPEGGSLWQVFESLRQVSSELRAAGSDPSQHVPRLSKVLRARVQAALEGPRSAPPVATPEGGGEERAAAYRRRFPAHPGAFRSLQAIEQALAGAGEAVAPLVTEDVAERLAAEDLRQVEARLHLLEEWLGQEREAVRAQLSLLRSTEQASALQKQLSEGHLAKLILEEREADAILDELKALSVRRPVAPESFERAAALRDAMHALAGEVLEARSRLIDFGKMGPARMNL
ncbi:MAG: hypothetical protein HY901_33290 [Deltaproteobacteria bacterium]|nr:hypothetical protein [Deltaproteobacteria bacterium]